MSSPSNRPTSKYNRSAYPTRHAQRYELIAGEMLLGRIVRLPQPSRPYGHYLILEPSAGRYVALRATAKDGWTALARNLTGVQEGDEVTVTFRGWRQSAAGRRYRDVRVEVLP